MNKLQILVLISFILFSFQSIQAQTYCAVGSDSSADEWIQDVQIGTFGNNSGNDNGYGNHLNQTITLNEQSSYNFVLSPGFSGDAFSEYWRIWIDYNDDGDFNDINELVYDAGGGNTSAVSGAFTTPNLNNSLNTRMRVAMKYVGTFNDGSEDFSAPNSCGNVEFGEVEDYSVVININGTTTDDYCSNAGESSADEWIQSISIGEFTSNSGNNNGYANLTSNTITLEQGSNYDLELTPGYSGNAFTEHWRIWIDYNKDNDFSDANELVYDSGQGFDTAISTTFMVWNNAPLGETRLRVAMKYVGTFDDGSTDLLAPTPCNDFGFGEVEDYTVNITEPIAIPLPVAQFNANNTSGTNPLNVQFFDQSTNATSWSWSFPGGTPNSSTQQNPTIIYNNPGVYTVFLTVTNEAGINTETKTNFITVSESVVAPVANFNSNVLSGQSPLTVQFTDLSTNNPTSWNWTFEGGTPVSSSEQNPVVVFNEAGTYGVTLIAGNSAGSDNEIKQGYITVTEPNLVPVADFSSNQLTGSAPLQIQFFDQSTNSPVTWTWEFEGGTPASSTQQNPTVTYNLPGTYAVTLTCANVVGADSETKTGYITVTEQQPLPIASFGASIFEGNPPLSVTFFDLSANDPIAWDWELPGAVPATSNEKNPTVVYNETGSFPVTLTVTNNEGSNTQMQLGYINVVPVISGVDEVEWQAELYLYPNPAHDFINLEMTLEEPKQPFYELHSLVGKKVKEKKLPNQSDIKEQIDLSDLPTGVYFITLQNGDAIMSRRISVNK